MMKMPTTQADYEPVVIVDTTGLSKEEWLEYRRTGIGGSDAAAIYGESPFVTCRDLYYDKRKIVAAVDDEDNWVQKEIGHLLEDLVAKIFHVKTGYRIFKKSMMFRHPLYPFMIADVDYFVELPDGTIAILEIKTTNYNNQGQWWQYGKEVVPKHYEYQGRHYMCVMNLNRVYYCCLYGNSFDEVIIRHIDRDLSMESEMIALEDDFWLNHVTAEVAPPYTEDGGMVIESISRHYGAADREAPDVELNTNHIRSVTQFIELRDAKLELDRQGRVLKNQMDKVKGLIVDKMGKSCAASCDVGDVTYAVTYNPVKRPEISKDNLLRLQERLPEVYEEYVTVSEYRKFNVRLLEKEVA